MLVHLIYISCFLNNRSLCLRIFCQILLGLLAYRFFFFYPRLGSIFKSLVWNGGTYAHGISLLCLLGPCCLLQVLDKDRLADVDCMWIYVVNWDAFNCGLSLSWQRSILIIWMATWKHNYPLALSLPLTSVSCFRLSDALHFFVKLKWLSPPAKDTKQRHEHSHANGRYKNEKGPEIWHKYFN